MIKIQMFQTKVKIVLDLEHWDFEFVSDFGFSISSVYRFSSFTLALRYMAVQGDAHEDPYPD